MPTHDSLCHWHRQSFSGERPGHLKAIKRHRRESGVDPGFNEIKDFKHIQSAENKSSIFQDFNSFLAQKSISKKIYEKLNIFWNIILKFSVFFFNFLEPAY